MAHLLVLQEVLQFRVGLDAPQLVGDNLPHLRLDAVVVLLYRFLHVYSKIRHSGAVQRWTVGKSKAFPYFIIRKWQKSKCHFPSGQWIQSFFEIITEFFVFL